MKQRELKLEVTQKLVELKRMIEDHIDDLDEATLNDGSIDSLGLIESALNIAIENEIEVQPCFLRHK